MSSNRVNDGNALDQKAEYHGKYMIAPSRKRWRVYTDGSYYSQTSGGVVVRGKVLRTPSGTPVSFETKKEAEQWIDGGCRVVDDKGNELF